MAAKKAEIGALDPPFRTGMECYGQPPPRAEVPAGKFRVLCKIAMLFLLLIMIQKVTASRKTVEEESIPLSK